MPVTASIDNLVHTEGLEPPRLAAPDPKSGAATNYATRASCFDQSKIFQNGSAKIIKIIQLLTPLRNKNKLSCF